MKRSTILILGGALLVVLLLCAALFVALTAGRDSTTTGWDPRWDRDRNHWDSPMWELTDGSRVGMLVLGLLGLLSCLLLVGGLVLGGVWLANRSRPSPPGLDQPSEIEALRGRYARGEISREEYLARRDDLAQ